MKTFKVTAKSPSGSVLGSYVIDIDTNHCILEGDILTLDEEVNE